MEKVLRIISKSHIGLIVFIVLQISMLVYLTNGNSSELAEYFSIYLVTTAMALSPVGEFILCLFSGATSRLRADIEEELQPIADEIIEKIKERAPMKNVKIKWRELNAPIPCAAAIGRHTIAVSTALMELPYDQIEGILADEIAHLALHHNVAMMIAGCSNPLVLFFWIMLQIAKWIVIIISTVLSIISSDTAGRIAGLAMSGLTAIFVWSWTTLCTIFIAFESRQNVYEADQYAAELGYGYALASALNDVGVFIPNQGFLHMLQMTHPRPSARINRLIRNGVEYSSF